MQETIDSPPIPQVSIQLIYPASTCGNRDFSGINWVASGFENRTHSRIDCRDDGTVAYNLSCDRADCPQAVGAQNECLPGEHVKIRCWPWSEAAARSEAPSLLPYYATIGVLACVLCTVAVAFAIYVLRVRRRQRARYELVPTQDGAL